MLVNKTYIAVVNSTIIAITRRNYYFLNVIINNLRRRSYNLFIQVK